MSKHKLSFFSISSLQVASVCMVCLCLAVSAFSDSTPEEQLPAGPGKEKVELACLSCHEARIIVQQRLSKPAWTKEVDKMSKWGAEVSGSDRDAVIDYLSANFTSDQPPYDPPRSATSKTKSK